MKYKCSKALQEKLKLVLYVFRSYGVPDEVFNYMIDPLFVTDHVDIGVLDESNKKFVSIYECEYDYDFRIKRKDEWEKLNCGYVKDNINLNNNYALFDSQGFNISIIANEEKIFIVLKFKDYDVDIYVCKYGNLDFEYDYDYGIIDYIKKIGSISFGNSCNNPRWMKMIRDKLFGST